MEYLSTKASLERNSSSNEARLTENLLPVREALPINLLDFDALLQRDLDDHRVSISLIPYLLKPTSSGPAYFPPIVAVLMPFSGQKPLDHFEGPQKKNFLKKDDWGDFNCAGYEGSFLFGKLFHGQENQLAQLKLGKLEWNKEKCKLVIVDGQHRAMALLAAARTLNGTWGNYSAQKYESFYSRAVDDCIRTLSEEEKTQLCSRIELAVNILIFPDPKVDQIKTARKLFVDVNQNARKASESRVMLLADDNLMSIFLRKTLNEFRTSANVFPIYGIEYDNPTKDDQTSSKWSVISTAQVINMCIERLLMGPNKLYRMDQKIGGRENLAEHAVELRESLDLLNLDLDELIEDQTSYKATELSNTRFAKKWKDVLTQQYQNGWGYLINSLLKLEPYDKHKEALLELNSKWIANTSPSGLARDAIFEGVGVFWTIKEARNHFDEIYTHDEPAKRAAARNDVIEAWDVLEEKHDSFKKIRARLFLEKDNEESVKKVEAAYDVFKTNACQVGFILAVKALWIAQKEANRKFEGIPAFVDLLVAGINSSLTLKRKLVFVNRQKLNNFPIIAFRLEPAKAVYFRYIWMELLCTPEGLAVLRGEPELMASAERLRDIGRKHYRDFIVTMFLQEKRKERFGTPEQCKQEAEKIADRILRSALRRWFGIKKTSYEKWKVSAYIATPASVEPDTSVDNRGELSSESEIDFEAIPDQNENLTSNAEESDED